jgi:hypothetical protein
MNRHRQLQLTLDLNPQSQMVTRNITVLRGQIERVLLDFPGKSLSSGAVARPLGRAWAQGGGSIEIPSPCLRAGYCTVLPVTWLDVLGPQILRIDIHLRARRGLRQLRQTYRPQRTTATTRLQHRG